VNKRLLILVVLAAFVLSAAAPWPAILTVVNYTGGNVYFALKFRGEQKYFLTATPQGNSADYYVSRFDITRRTYSAQVTACDVTTTWGRLNINANLRLVFTDCVSMQQYWTPKYWGEPGMEKPNFYDVDGGEHGPPWGTWWGSRNWKCPGTSGTWCYLQGPYARAYRFLYNVQP